MNRFVNVFFILPLLAAKVGFSICTLGAVIPDTLVFTTGTIGFTVNGNVGVYTPEVAGALNSLLANCQDSSLVNPLTINLKAANIDTLYLSTPIRVIRGGKPTVFKGFGRNNGPLILADLNAAPGSGNASLFEASSPIKIEAFVFARRFTTVAATTSSIYLSGSARRSVITGCQFWLQNAADSGYKPASIEILTDSVLIERNLFRSPPNGMGRADAIYFSFGSFIEIRSNLFSNAGISVQSAGFFHVFANTFVGTRENYSAITIDAPLIGQNHTANIQHNLFAIKNDFLPPIHYRSALTTSADSIRNNAWTRSSPSLRIAMYGQTGPINPTTLTNSATDSNRVLPKGFSNYGNAVILKDFPLTQLRANDSMNPAHALFGQFPSIFRGNPASIATVQSSLNANPAKFYFPVATYPFLPFNNLQSWTVAGTTNDVRVGALVLPDPTYQNRPSPIKSGNSLTFIPSGANPAEISLQTRIFDSAYYGGFIPPSNNLFYFDTSRADLTSDDSAGLRTVADTLISKAQGAGAALVDPVFSLPRDIRNGKPIFVKILHYNSSNNQAVVADANAVVDTVIGVPAYPMNDLGIKTDTAASNFQVGSAVVTVSKPPVNWENIDSVRVNVVSDVSGSTIATMVRPIPNPTASFTFPLIPRGRYHFVAVPMGDVNGVTRTGLPTGASATEPVDFQSISGDVVYYEDRAGCSPPGAGSYANAFCDMDSAVAYLESRGGTGVLIVKKTSRPIIADTIKAFGTQQAITIISELDTISGGGTRFPAQRPIFRGTSTNPALTILRSNVTLKGFVFELPPGSAQPAVVAGASGSTLTLESSLFRITTNVSLASLAMSLRAKQGNISHNVFWGFRNSIDFADSSSRMKVINNTFINDPSIPGFNSATALSVSFSVLNAQVRSNFFSGYNSPFAPSFQGKNPIMRANVYSVHYPMGSPPYYTESPLLDSTGFIPAVDLSVLGYSTTLHDNVFALLEPCGGGSSECSPLFAAADTSYPPGVVDFFGKPRSKKPEVGAYEFENPTNNILGRLNISVTQSNNFSEALVTVNSQSFDTSVADSVFLWWSLANNTTYSAAQTAGNYRTYPLSRLPAITEIITGLLSDTNYWFYTMQGNVSTDNAFQYQTNLRTLSYLTMNPCLLIDEVLGVCPANTAGKIGQWIDTIGTYRNLFRSDLIFNELISATDTGRALAPRYLDPDSTRLKGIVPMAGMPMIRVDVTTQGTLGQVGSGMSYTLRVEKLAAIAGLDSQQLFILPSTPAGLPTFVSTWSTQNVTPKTKIDIKVDKPGVLDFVFGRMSGAAGVVDITPPNATTFIDYALNPSSVNLQATGSSFRTTNPFIVATPIPAGGMVSRPVFSNSTYPVNSALITSGLTSLIDSLKTDRAYAYYLKVLPVDQADFIGYAAGGKKPFVFGWNASVPDWRGSVDIEADIVVANDGSATFPIPVRINPAFRQLDRAARSIEVMVTVFDGGIIRRNREFLRVRFVDDSLTSLDKVNPSYRQSQWHLYSYPWDEDAGGAIGRLVGMPTTINYPKQKILLYRGSGEGKGAYIEINSNNFNTLPLDSGRAFWSGNVEAPYQPKSAGGITLDYQTFNLPLPSGSFHDFGIPFNFPIRWKDVVLNSSAGVATLKVWKFVATTDGKGMWDSLTMASTLLPWEGYTVSTTSNENLFFKVLDSNRSNTPIPKVAARASVWEAKLWASDENSIVQLHLAKAGYASNFNNVPLVPGQSFLAGFQGGVKGERWTEIIENKASGLEGSWPLIVKPGEGFTRLSLQVKERKGLAIPLTLVETMQGKTFTLSDTAIHLTAEDLKAGDYHLVAGGAEYLDSFLAGMTDRYHLNLVNFPNPFIAQTFIHYSLPASFQTVEYRLRIHDFRGRLVWSRNFNGNSKLNTTWNGTDGKGHLVSGGQYYLRVEALVPGKPIFRAQRKLIKLN